MVESNKFNPMECKPASELVSALSCSAGVELSSVTETRFDCVPVGGWFKESENGCWYLKTSVKSAHYRSNGVSGEPNFSANETVLIE